VGTTVAAAVIPEGNAAENTEVNPSVCPSVTTDTPRVVELIVGNVYTSDPVTVNVYLVPYEVANSKETEEVVVAVYATLTVRAVVLTP
jgi:hypothetical protein